MWVGKIYKVRRKIKLEAREWRKEKKNIENKEVMGRKVDGLRMKMERRNNRQTGRNEGR